MESERKSRRVYILKSKLRLLIVTTEYLYWQVSYNEKGMESSWERHGVIMVEHDDEDEVKIGMARVISK